ncbi:MAG: hypothetical protein WC089_01235 [Candidatus Paceibacterota bacterium]
MSFEIPKPNIKPEAAQTTMNFDQAAIEFAMKQKQKALDEINNKYPEAKIPMHLVDGDEINGYKVKGESLEEYAKSQDLIYGKPQGKIEEKEDNLYHRN